MIWPASPWEPGNWYRTDGTASSGQSQGALSAASSELVAFAQTGQQNQTISASLGNGLHLIGGVSSGQSAQTNYVVANPLVNSAVSGGQVSATISFAAVEIVGTVSSGQSSSSKIFSFADPDDINASLAKLLRYPHSSIFDVDSEKVLALRIGRDWSVEKGVLTIHSADFPRKFALGDITLAELVETLLGIGIPVTYANTELLSLGAHILLDGNGAVSTSNGDHLYAYSALIWALFGGYSVAIDKAAKAVTEAIKQMVIRSSQDEWLDLWGEIYNQPRPDGMNDEAFAEYIPKEAFRKRINALAIEKAILDATGKVVRIEEPWKFMFRLDESRLSSGHRFFDGTTVGPFLLRPVASRSIDFTDVLDVIERNRAAGTVVLPPEVRAEIGVDGNLDGTVSMVRTDFSGAFIPAVSANRLDFMRLSNEELEYNYEVAISQVKSFGIEGDCPDSASFQTFGIVGITWRDPNNWGDFTWDDSASVANMGVTVDGDVISAVQSFDIDYVEIT